MADIDFSALEGGQFVLHFGGRPREVDVFTFSNSLLSFSEAIREINRQVAPKQSVDITLDAIGPGSFRAVIKSTRRGIGKLFQHVGAPLLLNVAASYIYEAANPAPEESIEIREDTYIIRKGNDRIIIPQAAWDLKRSMPEPNKVKHHVAKAYQVLEGDASVTEFGIASHIKSRHLIAEVPRSSFATGASSAYSSRHQVGDFVDQQAKLTVVRAVLEKSTRRWQFVWNGQHISAPILDPAFYEKLAARSYSFSQGDVLNTILRIHRHYDEDLGAYINDYYEVVAVESADQMLKQHLLFSDDNDDR